MHLSDKLAPADLFIFHGDADEDVNVEKHSVRLYEKMKDKLNIKLHIMPNKAHCQMTDDGYKNV